MFMTMEQSPLRKNGHVQQKVKYPKEYKSIKKG
jgi:hypothetical protein